MTCTNGWHGKTWYNSRTNVMGVTSHFLIEVKGLPHRIKLTLGIAKLSMIRGLIDLRVESATIILFN